MSGNHSDAHSQLVHDILLALGARPDGRVWRNSVGAARPTYDPKRVLFFGLKGSSDVLGIVGPRGRWLAVEAKTGNAKPDKDQLAFLAMINRFGGVGRVVHSVDEARAAYAEALQ